MIESASGETAISVVAVLSPKNSSVPPLARVIVTFNVLVASVSNVYPGRATSSEANVVKEPVQS